MTPLEDIENIEAWVRWQVGRFMSKGNGTQDQFEDLCSEGIVILYELHKRWEPAKSRGSFAAHAKEQFPLRLIDWYRKELRQSGRGHVPQQWVKGGGKGTGKRGKIQYHGMVSLSATEEGEPVHAFMADRALTSWDAVE